VETCERRSRWFDLVWLLAWGVASSLWCLTASAQLSATFDEPTYLKVGLDHWRTGSYAGLLQLGTMPLPVDVETLPIYIWERASGVTFDPLADMSRILPLARAGTLVFWWVLLIYGMKAGRQLGGPWAGRLAVALLACEPSLLAHASLATTDVAITACLLAFVYHFRTGIGEAWGWRVGAPMICFAAAILAKASGLVFGPICMLAVEIERISRTPGDERGWLTRLRTGLRWRDLITIGVGGFALTFVYCGSDWQPQTSFVAWAHRLPDGVTHDSMVWLSEHLRVFPNAGHGIIRQITHNVRGHGVYLLGHEDPRALWYYFPVLLTIKASAALLLGFAVLLLFRRSALWNWACLSAAALAAFSVACRVQIGIRFMLPLMALAIVGLAGALVAAWRGEGIVWRRHLLTAVAVLAVAWTGTSVVRVWPDGICYVNEIWGGTAAGYSKVSESNYDWGQGLKELERWHEENPGPLALWYFGTDPAAQHGSAEPLALHALKIEGPDDVRRAAAGRRLAVGTSLLYCAPGDMIALRRARDFLRTCKPIARTPTFLIFELGEAD
jgi:hypothetical protein